MSLTPEDRRWEILARELPFQQIGALRAQADGWRNGTAAAVTILAAVAIAKSRNDVTQLDPVWRGIVVGAVVVGFAALMVSFASPALPGVTVVAVMISLSGSVAK